MKDDISTPTPDGSSPNEIEGEIAELRAARAELRQRDAALRRSEHRRDSALLAAEMGTWDYDLVADVCHFDARAQQLYNLPSDQLDHRPEGVASVVHPDDVGPMFDEIQRATDVKGDGRYDMVYRIAKADGTYRWLRAVGTAEFEGNGAARRAVRIVGASRDITLEREAEAALRESEERQAFLLELGDATRRPASAEAKIEAAARMLGERLNASRVLWAEYDWERNLAHIFNGWFADGAEPFPTVMQLAGCEGEVLNELKAGRTVRIDNVGLLSEEPAYAAIAKLGVQALLSPPLLVGGKLRVNLSIHQHEPRHWTDDEVALVEEVSERLWAEVVRARTETALRASEEKYRTVFETMGQGYCELELVRDDQGRAVDQLYLELNPAFERLFGISVADAKGRRASDVFPFVDPIWHERFDEVATTGAYQRFEHQHGPLHPWFEVFVYPRGGDRVVVLYEEITDRKRAEIALRESEDRQAFLLKLSDDLKQLADAAAIQSTTARLVGEHLGVDRSMYGLVEGEQGSETGTILGQYVRQSESDGVVIEPFPDHFTFADFGQQTMARRYRGEPLVVPDIDSASGFEADEREAWRAANVLSAVVIPLVKGGRLVAEFGVHCSTRREWTDAEVDLLADVAERTWAAVERVRAEAALRESERHATLLLAELQHRVRNTLAVVRSIARRTAENSTSVEGMVAHFQGRLDAFSRVQAALTRSVGARVDLASLIQDELVAHATREGDQVRIDGPDLTLDPKTAERLSLAIHELTTNAVKHGALMSDRGRVEIKWSRKKANGSAELLLSWRETGLKLDSRVPEREGFGMELLLRSLPYDLQAKTKVELEPDGLRFELRMPLAPPASV